MDTHIDDLLKEYDDFMSSNPKQSIVSAKGNHWAAELLRELRRSKVHYTRMELIFISVETCDDEHAYLL